MLKLMNLLFLTLSMNILMSISSNVEITDADRNGCRDIFNDIDDDKNGNITEGDVNTVFSDSEKLKKFKGMILEKETFKEALLKYIRENGDMNFDAFVRFLIPSGTSFE
ncbi:uncharacterized protein LOC111059924 [Nilaparvata lugens]|uniref:uncharacterized protein LOC111059924 n=1 Tax=Nilaparvata lugens TaxID=108931 RepID=UPI00193CB88A|nr:uncharacterized protein LOC111059924 [Nilaparvata lugens]